MGVIIINNIKCVWWSLGLGVWLLLEWLAAVLIIKHQLAGPLLRPAFQDGVLLCLLVLPLKRPKKISEMTKERREQKQKQKTNNSLLQELAAGAIVDGLTEQGINGA